MLNSVGSRGTTISSLIAASPLTSSALSHSTQSIIAMPAAPLSAAAIKISRDSRLLEHMMPKVGQGERMTLLNWFLEEEKLKRYEVFKEEFFEDPDEYNYALSSLLGTLVWDVAPVSPNSGTMGTFVAPNLQRRNNLYPFQAALTEKWKAIGAAFSHSWLNALDKAQREALIMRSFIDTANINKEMTDARRQSFDLRTSELSGRGFISFIQEHCLQNSTSQTGGTPVSLPHTENMVRVFKDWVEKSGSPPDDDNNDTLFRRSCALSLRDKCIYSRALFATRLCITVLDMWEQIIRTVEIKRGRPSKSNDANIECAPVTAVTEVEAPAKQTKPKKKKKGKTGKKARRTATSVEEVHDEPAAEHLVTETRVEDVGFEGFEDDFAVASGTDESKSSGVSSPTGTGGEESKLSSSTTIELRVQHRNAQNPVVQESEQESLPVSVNGNALANTVDRDDNVDILIPDDSSFVEERQNSTSLHEKIDGLGEADIQSPEEQQKGDVELNGPLGQLGQLSNQSNQVLSINSAIIAPAVSNSPELYPQFPTWEDFSDKQEAEWLPVMGKKKKHQTGDKHRTGPSSRQIGKELNPERRPTNTSLHTQKQQGNSRYPPKVTSLPPQTPAAPRLQLQQIRRITNPQSLKTITAYQPSNGATKQVEGTGIMNNTLADEHPFKELTSNSPVVEDNTHVEKDSTHTSIGPVQVGVNGGEITDIRRELADNNDAVSGAASLAESEVTDISSSAINIKGKKHKSQRKRTKSTSKEQSTGSDPSSLAKDGVLSSELPNLENITFFCAVCHRPRGYHHSLQCSICPPGSIIRYCSVSCQRQDSEHWRLCGLTPFPFPVIIPGGTISHGRNIPKRSWMTPALARQRMLLAEQKNVDYFLFSPSVDSPEHKLTIYDEQLRSQFKKLRDLSFQEPDVKAVTLIYKIMKSHCEEKSIKLTPQNLAFQLFSEFGVNPLLLPTSKDLQITPQDWIEAGI